MKKQFESFAGKLFDYPITQEQAFRTSLWINRNCDGSLVKQGYVISSQLQPLLPIDWDKVSFIHLQGQMHGLYLAIENEPYSEANNQEGDYALTLIMAGDEAEPSEMASKFTDALMKAFAGAMDIGSDFSDLKGSKSVMLVKTNGVTWRIDPEDRYPSDQHDSIANYIVGLTMMFSSVFDVLDHDALVDAVHERYMFPMPKLGGTIEDGVFKYTGDPDQHQIARATIGRHTILVFPSAVTGIITNEENGDEKVTIVRID